MMGTTRGLAFAGRRSATLFWTMCEEKSASVVLLASWSMMTGLRASGAMVVTYWSVLVTVRIAQTEITEIGMSSDASTMSTQEMIPPRPRAPWALFCSAISDGLGSGDSARRRVLGVGVAHVCRCSQRRFRPEGIGGPSLHRCSTKCVDGPSKSERIDVRIMGVSAHRRILRSARLPRDHRPAQSEPAGEILRPRLEQAHAARALPLDLSRC